MSTYLVPVMFLTCLATEPARDWQGFDRFFAVLADEGVRVRSTAPDLDAADVIIVLGTAPLDPAPSAFAAAVEHGATLLVASEQGRLVNRLLREFSLEITGEFVTCGAALSFRKQRDCPLVRSFERNRAPELFTGVDAIATNRGRNVAGEGEILAHYPPISVLGALLQEIHPGPRAVFCRRRKQDRGRVIAIGDQSIAINLMLEEEDNERFLRNIVQSARAQTAVVFINGLPCAGEDERIAQLGRLTDIPPVPMAPAVEDVNRLIGDLQRAFPLREHGRTVLPLMLLLGGMILFMLLVREILNTYVHGEKAVPGKARPSAGWVLAAQHLTTLAPEETRGRLFRLTRACRRPAGRRRFFARLAAARAAGPEHPNDGPKRT